MPIETNPLYVPALKWKQGEQRALASLDPQIAPRIVPLIELVPPEKPAHTAAQKAKNQPAREAKPINDKAAEDVESIVGSWPRLCYLDPALQVQRSTCAVYKTVFDLARKQGANCIPVVRLGAPNPCYKQAGDAHKADNRGACIRVAIPWNIATLAQDVNAAIVALAVPNNRVDVLIDGLDLSTTHQSAWFYANLATAIADIRAACQPRNIIVLGGSIPKSFAAQPVGDSRLDRFEWSIYTHHRGKIAPIYVFGDYAINAPVYQHAPASGPPNIRYADTTDHWISKGLNTSVKDASGKVQTKFFQLHAMALRLTNLKPTWKGAAFSAGDQFISDVAGRQTKPGNQTDWRSAGTSHHITFVVEQLANLAGPAAASLQFP